MTKTTAPSERTRIKRYNWLADYRPETLHAVLDATPLCHVGYVHDGVPVTTPTMQWRDGDRIYWHGSSASRFLRNASDHEVCVSVSIVDGIVMARSGYNCTLNYRSAMIFGTATKIVDPEEKEQRLAQFVDRLVPGQWERLRPVTSQEVKATTILSVELTETSVKLRDGPSDDDEADYDLPVWAGVIPIRYVVGEPQADPRNLPGVVMPDEMRAFRFG